MKKFLIIFLMNAFVFLFFASSSFAATLYSNDFTSSYSGFNEYFGHCAPGSSGLTCTGTDAFYNIAFPTMACVSADINISNIRDGLFFADGNFNSWIGFTASGSLVSSDGHLHAYDSNTPDYDLGVNTPPPGVFHTYTICKNSDVYTFYLDSTLIGTKIFTGHSGGYFGFEAKPGTIITNFVATDSFPTPTSTPTPTPTPAIHLNVPLIKQTSDPWQSLEYDSAHVWAPLDKTIHDWGCALTSAVMVLQYNGIVKMPDNTPLNPGSLNTWLKSQPDGYGHNKDGTSNGWVNWNAISRLTQLVRLAFNNPNFTADALEYKIPTSATTSQLVTDLTNNIPDILGETGHFVVATGTQGNTFTINDPYFSRNTLNDGYNNTFLSIGRYVPSHTDLSYILITGDPSLTFTLTNGSNQSVGSSYIQQPLVNDTNPAETSGQPFQIFYLEQPADGLYTLTATSSGQNQPISFNEYLYDKSGNVTTAAVSGTTNNNGQFVAPIVFKKVTFQSLLTDLQNAFDLKTVSQGAYSALGSQIKNIQKEMDKGQTLVVKVHLNVISLLLDVLPGITPEAKTLLQSDIAVLLQSL